ncbi:hypothetical protein [Vulcanisaeta souniana]|uniref:Uncharacterized protein n=1 Tax=Vulcanisaeta souniana JCM 11219 TaxID=1293586 RepID=A0A830ED50_9CREN|nr:hypothetical protein [Vulcanisaeta souniana]BDR91468.1 hypothetical protein Vsou_05610 [Vulcanisaeta souniana JCM 11219]GGI73392.1 hypothetical protein GCM10007112_07810 [Vulcanisaeta souniana JCM 11219]
MKSIGFTIVIIIVWILVEIVPMIFTFMIIIPLMLKVPYGLGVFLAWLIDALKALK